MPSIKKINKMLRVAQFGVLVVLAFMLIKAMKLLYFLMKGEALF